jgi:outer membrane lipopolysaccharide assembly protein LptE/RlpB
MSPRQSPARLLVALSLVCLLPACGFALRGSETVAADGTTVHLRAAEPGSALVQTLSEALLAAEVMQSRCSAVPGVSTAALVRHSTTWK